ncbi:MAG TPA: hypothetical protein VIJ46_03690 [Rhabdochlamydiaceae bacterium]
MSVPPVSSSDPLRTNSVAPGATQAPIGIAAAPTVLTPALTRYDFPMISAFIHWVSDCLMALWEYFMKVLFPVPPAAEEIAWKGLLANANANPHVPSALDNATIQRVCGDTRRTFVGPVAHNQLEMNYASILLRGTDATVYTQLDMDLQRGAHVFISGQQFYDSGSIAADLRNRGFEGEALLKVLSSLSQETTSDSVQLLMKLFMKHDGPVETHRHPFPDTSENAFRADIDFEGNTLRSIRISHRAIVKHFPSMTPLFKVSAVTVIDGATGQALVTGTTRPANVP